MKYQLFSLTILKIQLKLMILFLRILKIKKLNFKKDGIKKVIFIFFIIK